MMFYDFSNVNAGDFIGYIIVYIFTATIIELLLLYTRKIAKTVKNV